MVSESKAYTQSEYNPDGPLETVEDGPVSEPSGINAQIEDREAEESERTGNIPKREVEELRSEGNELPSRTRGKKIDAYKQERDLDNALKQEGAYDDDDF